MSRARARLAAVVGLCGAIVFGTAAAAEAHPLGNFTVNHYDGLVVFPDHLVDIASVDTAEIPTLQQVATIDTNHDGRIDGAERAEYAAKTCAALAGALRADVGGRRLSWRVDASAFAFHPGAIGLRTSRLDCRLATTAAFAVPADLSFADAFEGDRVGWHEITASGTGVHFTSSSVPARSVSDQLRHYPNDLLSSPLSVRSAQLHVVPGAGHDAVHGQAKVPTAGLLSRKLNALGTYFDRLAGSRHLTVLVGLFAILLSVALGAAHALLPGHGKTVMAAYIAGQHGRTRDAIAVGATVTLTHTGGVLVLGLALTASTSLAGESVLSYLGVASGLLIAAIGAALLRTTWRRRRHERDHAAGHTHDHEHEHVHEHGHSHRTPSRRDFIGMGIAGGLIPSPSAVVVLLGAVALGRTLFGVGLVLGYGLGMAATLTAVGILMVRLRDRLEHSQLARRLNHRADSVRRLAPVATAGLVLVVGSGIALRGLATVL